MPVSLGTISDWSINNTLTYSLIFITFIIRTAITATANATTTGTTTTTTTTSTTTNTIGISANNLASTGISAGMGRVDILSTGQERIQVTSCATRTGLVAKMLYP